MNSLNKITKDRIDERWFRFKYDKYEGVAMIWPEASSYGIGGGTISKLEIKKNGSPIYWYERGSLDTCKISGTALNKIINFLKDAAQ